MKRLSLKTFLSVNLALGFGNFALGTVECRLDSCPHTGGTGIKDLDRFEVRRQRKIVDILYLSKRYLAGVTSLRQTATDFTR